MTGYHPFYRMVMLGRWRIVFMISVLYVDDCSSLLYCICRFLESKGDMEVETALSTKDASRILDYISFDVIVTDYNTEESSGIGLLQQARQKGIMTPFIFFTLEKNGVMELEAAQYGRVAFVPKILKFGSSCDGLEKAIRTIFQKSHAGNLH
jgi:DNA-binding NtrC family response regulator